MTKNDSSFLHPDKNVSFRDMSWNAFEARRYHDGLGLDACPIRSQIKKGKVKCFH